MRNGRGLVEGCPFRELKASDSLTNGITANDLIAKSPRDATHAPYRAFPQTVANQSHTQFGFACAQTETSEQPIELHHRQRAGVSDKHCKVAGIQCL